MGRTPAEILSKAHTIALVGASPKPWRPSNGVMRYLLEQGYRVIPVRPVGPPEILGVPRVASLAEIEETIDLVDVFRRSEHCPDVARDAVAALALAAVFVLAGAAFTAPATEDELLKDELHFLQQSKKTFTGGQKAAQMSENMEVVGHTDLGGRGFNADVWFHEGFAYVGHWGFTDWAAGSKQRFCPDDPNNGVAVVDATDPTEPTMISRLVNPDGTSAEDVVVFQAPYGPLSGRDIAAVGIQVCGGSRYDTTFFRGLQLFDVTDPTSPVELGRLNTGCCTRGLHELEVEHRDDLGRTFVYASVPASEYPDSASPTGFRDQQGRGD